MNTMTVLDPGFLTTVQDLGRPGLAHLGVSGSGAVDPDAHRLANRLVGNPESAATLETTLLGVTVTFAHSVVVAVTGARCELWVGERQAAMLRPVHVPSGSALRLGPSAQARSYLAVSGGIDAPVVMGSRSTGLLSGLGCRPLGCGDRLRIGLDPGEPRFADTAIAQRNPGPGIRVLLGPRDDWFADATLELLDGAKYLVSAASNRIGLRLQGPELVRRRPGELAPEPMVLGAIQVPPDGQPVIFLNDHPTTGGYPVIGVVHPDDLFNCAQAKPGDPIEFRVVLGP